MSPRAPAPVLVQDRHRFDVLIDARSPSEFALDHIPGAINCPVLDDEERRIVGTIYKQQGAFEARRVGAAMVAANLARHIDQRFSDKPHDWKPLIYCWRGGLRSGSMTTWLRLVGWDAQQLTGGYKRWRQHVIATLEDLCPQLPFHVICGATGSAKTRLLHALAQEGAQVLDLEGLARHKGSLLGALPGQPQPSQKHFDMRVWHALKQFDPTRPVFVESESKKVGNVAVPEALILAMRAAPCMNLLLSDQERVALLMEEYDFFVQNTDAFCERLGALTELRGHEVVKGWVAQVHSGHIADVVQELLTHHYDPVYIASMKRNFAQYAQAVEVSPVDRTPEAMLQEAKKLVAELEVPV